MIAIILIFFLSVLYICWNKGRKSKYNRPPGPWFKFPVLGHMPFLGADPHLTLTKWSSIYGPVISIQLGSFPTVIINDGRILKQACGSSALVGRPRIKVLDDYSRRQGVAFLDGPHFREQRRFALATLKDLTKTSDSMEARILDETDNLIDQLRAFNEKPMKVNRFFTCNVINSLLSVLMSKKFQPGDAELDEISELLLSSAHNNGFLAALGFYVPFLCSLFPEAVGYNSWVRLGNAVRDFFRPTFEDHSGTLIPGQPRDVLDTYLERVNASKDDPSSSFHDIEHILDTFRDFVAAGMETTTSQLEWLIHYMAKYPSIQARLIAEIDSKCPNDRMPSINERADLPYTEAVIQEALRISTTVPFGLFHSALEDTEVAGYRIPKDTVVIGNLYAVNNDPNVWDSPAVFRPERFIDQNGKFELGDNPVLSFGTGKRSCIGEGLARSQLFLFTVRIFQNFRVRAVSELRDDHKFALAVSPLPFEVVFERRAQTLAD